jgi:hypothetical protein
MNKDPYLAVGVDIQPRGLALGILDFDTLDYINSIWVPFGQGMFIEEASFYSWCDVSYALEKLHQVTLVTVELPAGGQSSSTMHLWCMCGAALAAAKNHCTLVQTMVPTEWKKYSGLNIWAKENGEDKKGVIIKGAVPDGMMSIIDAPVDLEPNDLYDALALALAGILYNKERFINSLPKESRTIL